MKKISLIAFTVIAMLVCCKKTSKTVYILYTIKTSSGPNGTINPIGEGKISPGGSITCTIIPDSGYSISGLIVDGTTVGPATTYTFTNVTSDHTINATFAKAFTITASAGPNGRVGSMTQQVITGTNTVVAFLPNDGFHADSVWLDGTFIKVLDGETSYALTNVTSNHTLKVSFSDLLTKSQSDSLIPLLIGKWTMTSLNSKLGDLQDHALPWDIQDIHPSCSSNVYSEYHANGVYVPNANLDGTNCSPLGGQQFQIFTPNHWQLRKNGKVIRMTDSPVDSLTNVTLTKDSLIAFYLGAVKNGPGRISYWYHYARIK